MYSKDVCAKHSLQTWDGKMEKSPEYIMDRRENKQMDHQTDQPSSYLMHK